MCEGTIFYCLSLSPLPESFLLRKGWEMLLGCCCSRSSSWFECFQSRYEGCAFAVWWCNIWDGQRWAGMTSWRYRFMLLLVLPKHTFHCSCFFLAQAPQTKHTFHVHAASCVLLFSSHSARLLLFCQHFFFFFYWLVLRPPCWRWMFTMMGKRRRSRRFSIRFHGNK